MGLTVGVFKRGWLRLKCLKDEDDLNTLTAEEPPIYLHRPRNCLMAVIFTFPLGGHLPVCTTSDTSSNNKEGHACDGRIRTR